MDLGSPNDDTRAELAACFGPSFLPQQNSCSDTKSKDNSELRSEGGNSKQAGCPLLAGAHRMRAGHRPISIPAGLDSARLASLLRGRASRLEEARRSRRVVYRQEEEG